MRRSTAASSNSSSLIAFTPRQVLLSDQQQRNSAVSTSMEKSWSKEKASSKSEDDSVLMYSVAFWLQNKGFTKVLKRFLSAAQIQDDNWKDGALDLNDIFAKYQGIGDVALEDANPLKKQGEQVDGGTQTNGIADITVTEESGRVKKKKKKKSKGDDAVAGKGKIQNGDANGSINELYANGKHDGDSKGSNGLSCSELKSIESKESDGAGVLEGGQSAKKEKAKNKKKIELMPQSLDGDEKETNDQELLEIETKERIGEAAEDGLVQSKKASKKRKRMAFDGNENCSDNEIAIEESKTKKSNGQNECAEDVPILGGAGYPGARKEKKDSLPENEVANSSESKSSRHKGSNSAETKTVNAFQRVKVDEVKFVDERLQDNSYWAKAGAENGYGAKAQEVLGQVKGRDFRHEKTKKKRGSYRGGQIDLQSHSIKFNNSDEE